MGSDCGNLLAYVSLPYRQVIPREVLNPFQIISHFGIFRFIVFAMYLDIYYVQIHSKSYGSRNAKTSYNLGWRSKSETPHILDGQLVKTSNLTTRRCGLITRPIDSSIKQVNNSANMGVN